MTPPLGEPSGAGDRNPAGRRAGERGSRHRVEVLRRMHRVAGALSRVEFPDDHLVPESSGVNTNPG
ncbi:MAG: hypothetical protein JZU52_09660 [Lamprocystis purpurea]|jgi:hypothetical protein|uniref:hypothetical protein n=1 Tax=Lamprocystis purpurea TaxID=61598 RepID=UPI0012FCE27A|nr:hypothetical protein [Lamprocystis purpurea]MBV5273889.1 hypothetical protein [Lamprocystis purpurea]